MTGSLNWAEGLSRAGLVSVVRLRGQTVCGNRWSQERVLGLRKGRRTLARQPQPASRRPVRWSAVSQGQLLNSGPNTPRSSFAAPAGGPDLPGIVVRRARGEGSRERPSACESLCQQCGWLCRGWGDSRDTSRAWSSLETQRRASRELQAEPGGRCRPAPCRPRLPGPGALAEPCSHLLPVRWRC